MPNYGETTYWDQRYAASKGEMFDWLEDYQALKDILKDYLKPESKILILGCGNANFSEDLYDAGYEHIWNIVISSVVIHQMIIRNQHRKLMKYEVMDVCNLRYPDNFFDIAIDKSTIDALLCGENSYVITAIMLKEAQRVVKEDGGVYFAISYGKPQYRSFHLERPFLSWDLKEFMFYPVGKEYKDQAEKEEKAHFLYICTKNKHWREAHAEHFEPVLTKLILMEHKQRDSNAVADGQAADTTEEADQKPLHEPVENRPKST